MKFLMRFISFEIYYLEITEVSIMVSYFKVLAESNRIFLLRCCDIYSGIDTLSIDWHFLFCSLYRKVSPIDSSIQGCNRLIWLLSIYLGINNPILSSSVYSKVVQAIVTFLVVWFNRLVLNIYVINNFWNNIFFVRLNKNFNFSI